jgi:hypothetical protein
MPEKLPLTRRRFLRRQGDQSRKNSLGKLSVHGLQQSITKHSTATWAGEGKMDIRRISLALAFAFAVALLAFGIEPARAGSSVPIDQLQICDEDMGVTPDKNEHADSRFYRPAVGGYRPAVGYYRPAAGYYRPAAGYYRPY